MTGKTSNVQHRTSNAEVSEDSRCHSMFGVGCSMLDVPLVQGEGQGEGSLEILQTGLDMQRCAVFVRAGNFLFTIVAAG